MPATQEILAEQIRELSERIANGVAIGIPVDNLRKELARLNEQLATATSALNESKQLLKG